MDDCQDVTGQMWAIRDNGNDTFQLQTQLLEAENQCLDGNQVIETALLGGAAFMDDCDQVAGQIWTATRATDFQFPEYSIGDVGPAGGIVFYVVCRWTWRPGSCTSGSGLCSVGMLWNRR